MKFSLKGRMSNSQQKPLNRCLIKDAGDIENAPDKICNGLDGTIGNRTCHSTNGKSLQIACTVPLPVLVIHSVIEEGEGEEQINRQTSGQTAM